MLLQFKSLLFVGLRTAAVFSNLRYERPRPVCILCPRRCYTLDEVCTSLPDRGPCYNYVRPVVEMSRESTTTTRNGRLTRNSTALSFSLHFSMLLGPLRPERDHNSFNCSPGFARKVPFLQRESFPPLVQLSFRFVRWEVCCFYCRFGKKSRRTGRCYIFRRVE